MLEQTIASLPASVIASFARDSFIFRGRERWTSALLYRALALEPDDATALHTLSGFLDGWGSNQFSMGFYMLSAAVLKYALDRATTVEDRALFAKTRVQAMWGWGFAPRTDGLLELTADDFEDIELFALQEDRYAAWWRPVLDDAGSLAACFAAAHATTGYVAGFLRQRAPDLEPTIAGVYPPADLVVQDAYAEWLAFDVERLESMVKRSPGM